MTAASVLKPAGFPGAPTPMAGRLPAGIRLIWLHLRTRRVPAGIVALAVCAVLLRATLHWKSSSDPQQFPLIVEAGAAAVIAVTTHGPFGEAERATGRWLPAMRLLAAAGMCGLAILALQLGVVGGNLNEGILVLARNVIGFTGLGLACSLVTGGLLAWVLPLGYLAFCQYALADAWSAPWTWPARPPADRGGWIAAAAVLAVALLAYTLRGPRTRPGDDA
ncbi:MAG: hypothetical protein ACRDOI_38210 [Trebonia sp.]